MPNFKSPLRDIRFLLQDVFEVEKSVKELATIDATTKEDWDPVLDEAAKFAEKVVHPLMRSGDEEGCKFENGKVKLPKGWVDSYKLYTENGWPLLEAPQELGGNPLPSFVRMSVQELLSGSNLCWAMLPGLTTAAVEVLTEHASEELKEKFIHKMAEGKWFGTMCLTEAHCGTDLGLVATKAVDKGNGTYEIDGSKIFITGGEHDATENIIHLVLARLPDSPTGTKGISLFLVPKFKVGADGSVQGSNNVSCSAIEHKMGIKGSPTCVINFEKSEGFIIGEKNQGLTMMFTMMNIARLGTGIQGLGAASASYWHALNYAKDRLQMRSLSGAKNPKGPADPIIVHPDVRRMLLTQKALTEGSRAMVAYASQLVDEHLYGKTKEVRDAANAKLGLLTPVIKGFCTEMAQEVVSHGLQVLGGHGYISESGQEQIARDVRISTIYEGTTGVQALDFLGRKILMNEGRNLRNFTKEVHLFCETNKTHATWGKLVEKLSQKNKEWGEMTMQIGMKAMPNPDEVGAASVDYLMYSGYVILGYLWLKMGMAAESKAATHAFYKGKVETCKFYFDRILPRTESLRLSILSGGANLMSLTADHFGASYE